MIRRHLVHHQGIAPSRALLAFGMTVVLALIASAALLWPDSATDAADSLARANESLDNWLPVTPPH